MKSFRQRISMRAWAIPLSYAVGAVIAALSVPRLEGDLWPHLTSPMSVGSAQAIYSASASGMIALTGIVFSLTFVMVQFSASSFSPRLVVWIAQDPIMSHSLGVFFATFLYAIAASAAGAGSVVAGAQRKSRRWSTAS